MEKEWRMCVSVNNLDEPSWIKHGSDKRSCLPLSTMVPPHTTLQKKITKKYRIPKKIDVVVDKLKNGKTLTKEQNEFMKKLVKDEIKNYKEMQKKMRRIVMLMRLQNDCLTLEEGEILE